MSGFNDPTPLTVYLNVHSLPLNRPQIVKVLDDIKLKYNQAASSIVLVANFLRSERNIFEAVDAMQGGEVVHCREEKMIQALEKHARSEISSAALNGTVVFVSAYSNIDPVLKLFRDAGWNPAVFCPVESYEAWRKRGIDVTICNLENLPKSTDCMGESVVSVLLPSESNTYDDCSLDEEISGEEGGFDEQKQLDHGDSQENSPVFGDPPRPQFPGFNGCGNGFNSPQIGAQSSFSSAPKPGLCGNRNGFAMDPTPSFNMSAMPPSAFNDIYATPPPPPPQRRFDPSTPAAMPQRGGFDAPTFAGKEPCFDRPPSAPGFERNGFNNPSFSPRADQHDRPPLIGAPGGGFAQRGGFPPMSYRGRERGSPRRQHEPKNANYQPLNTSYKPQSQWTDAAAEPRFPPAPPASAFPALGQTKQEHQQQDEIIIKGIEEALVPKDDEPGKLTYAQLASRIREVPEKPRPVEVKREVAEFKLAPKQFSNHPRIQCPAWKQFHPQCSYFHPSSECLFQRSCRNTAATCRHAHNYCVNGPCKCKENERDPQLHHWISGPWPTMM